MQAMALAGYEQPDAGDIYIPLVGVASLCQTYLQWNKSGTAAYFNLGAAIIIFICAANAMHIKRSSCRCWIVTRNCTILRRKVNEIPAS